MSDVPVSVAVMLDCSGSMSPVFSVMVNDAKAFVRSARPGDQIAVVAFQTNAWPVYPVPAALATVDPQLIVTAAAAAAIGGLTSDGTTNMGEAIELCAPLMPRAANVTQAFTLISDGWANTGPDPVAALPSVPPIFICGIGSTIDMSSFASMLAKNPQSLYFASPTENQMMQIFNEIRSLADAAALPQNFEEVRYSGFYQYTPVTVSDTAAEVQFSVVWESSNRYSTGAVGATTLNIILVDPTGRELPDQPVATEPGYAIFYVVSPMPGQWQVLMKYYFEEPTSVTIAAFEYGSDVQLTTSMPAMATVGSELTITSRVVGKDPAIEGLHVQANVLSPSISTEYAIQRYAEELSRVTPSATLLADGMPEDAARLETWRRATRNGHDILAPRRLSLPMSLQNDGTYTARLMVPIAGSYSVQVTATGNRRSSGVPLSRTAMAATLVT